MIFLQVFLGILAAFVVLRLFLFLGLRRRFAHHPGRGHRLYRLYRRLALGRDQKREIRAVFRELRTAVGDLRGDMPAELAHLLGGEVFDRVSAERLADDRLTRLAQAKAQAIAALERVHGLLTPAQRATLATF